MMMYAASTLSHSIHSLKAHRIFNGIDRSAIYLLIAGTYTPFTLVSLHGPWGWSLLSVVWGLALVGIILQLVIGAGYAKTSIAVYLLMGWTILVGIRPLVEAIGLSGLLWILAGGLFYTIGLIFFGWKALPYGHAVWHAFVLIGSVLHYAAVLLYVIPPPNGLVFAL
jgi:hemolysin III